MNPYPRVDDVDVLIVGAGISGIGIAVTLSTERPSTSFLMLEARAASGGTWDLFRYPGVRSDSDLHTFGYAFKPWRERESIASGARILAYLRETVTENGLDEHIRYGQRVVGADWSSSRARWSVEVEDVASGERRLVTAGWLYCATGYYRYDAGHTPAFAGRDRFRGRIVHPQQWPEDLDHAGRRVVVIGSGATAVTLAPALAETAGHVTMLQRTPGYVLPVAAVDRGALRMRRWFGEKRGYALTRHKNIAIQRALWLFCRRFPTTARRRIRRIVQRQLPDGYPVDEHFNPPYDPWDQRLCIVPDGDLFAAIRYGDLTVVTDRITTFTETGVQLASGRELEADLIVTATGLNLRMLGGISLRVDGRKVSPGDTVVYRGLMLSGVPNLALAFGYTNASWTLKIGELAGYFCRLLAHLDANGFDTARPIADLEMATHPLIDLAGGYVRRSVDELPKQGEAGPWRSSTGYAEDVRLLRHGHVVDQFLHLSGPADREQTADS
ncbi:MAG TPA: NAD(P)/FAD-dependent oxidoreductase [Microlunatus sp.]